jgi:hypothetical protein
MKQSNRYSIVSLIAVASIVLLPACASYKYSNKRKKEQIIVKVNENVNGIIRANDIVPQVDPSMSQGSRGLMIDAISMATDGIKSLIDMDKKKCSASYSSSKQQLYFYNYISDKGAVDPTGIQFEGIEIIRLAQVASNKVDTALYLRLVVDTQNPQEIINNSIFKMKVDSLRFNYAKAKIPSFRWYLPWTIFYLNQNKINLDVELNFMASWMYQNGTSARSSSIGSFALNLRDIPLNTQSNEYKKFYADIKSRPLSGYSFLVPRSYGHYLTEQGETKECFGQGGYDIVINMNESGREHFVSKLVLNNSSTIVDRINQRVVNKINGY